MAQPIGSPPYASLLDPLRQPRSEEYGTVPSSLASVDSFDLAVEGPWEIRAKRRAGLQRLRARLRDANVNGASNRGGHQQAPGLKQRLVNLIHYYARPWELGPMEALVTQLPSPDTSFQASFETADKAQQWYSPWVGEADVLDVASQQPVLRELWTDMYRREGPQSDVHLAGPLPATPRSSPAAPHAGPAESGAALPPAEALAASAALAAQDAQVGDAARAYQALQAQLQATKAELGALLAAKATAVAELEALRRENGQQGAPEALRSVQAELQSLRGEMQRLRGDPQEIQGDAQMAGMSEQHELTAQLQAAEAELQELQAERATLAQLLLQGRPAPDVATAGDRAAVATARRLRACEAEIAEVRAELEALRGEAEEAADSPPAPQWEAPLRAAEAELEGLRAERAALLRQLQDEEFARQVVESGAAGVEAANWQRATALQACEGQAAQQRAELLALRQALEEGIAARHEGQERYATAVRLQRDLEAQLQAAEAEARGLRAERAVMWQGLKETQEAQRQCNDQRTAASHRHQELTTQLSAAEAELQTLRAERGTVELQLQAAESSAATEKQLQTCQEAIAKLKAELEGLRGGAKAAAAHSADGPSTELQSWTGRLKAAEAELHGLQAERAAVSQSLEMAQRAAEAAQRGLAEAAGDAADRWRRCEAEAAAWRERLPALRAEAQAEQSRAAALAEALRRAQRASGVARDALAEVAASLPRPGEGLPGPTVLLEHCVAQADSWVTELGGLGREVEDSHDGRGALALLCDAAASPTDVPELRSLQFHLRVTDLLQHPDFHPDLVDSPGEAVSSTAVNRHNFPCLLRLLLRMTAESLAAQPVCYAAPVDVEAMMPDPSIAATDHICSFAFSEGLAAVVRARLAQRGRAAAAGGPRGAAGPIVAEVLGRLLEPAVAVADLLPRLPALAVGAAAAEEELSAAQHVALCRQALQEAADALRYGALPLTQERVVGLDGVGVAQLLADAELLHAESLSEYLALGGAEAPDPEQALRGVVAHLLAVAGVPPSAVPALVCRGDSDAPPPRLRRAADVVAAARAALQRVAEALAEEPVAAQGRLQLWEVRVADGAPLRAALADEGRFAAYCAAVYRRLGAAPLPAAALPAVAHAVHRDFSLPPPAALPRPPEGCWGQHRRLMEYCSPPAEHLPPQELEPSQPPPLLPQAERGLHGTLQASPTSSAATCHTPCLEAMEASVRAQIVEAEEWARGQTTGLRLTPTPATGPPATPAVCHRCLRLEWQAVELEEAHSRASVELEEQRSIGSLRPFPSPGDRHAGGRGGAGPRLRAEEAQQRAVLGGHEALEREWCGRLRQHVEPAAHREPLRSLPCEQCYALQRCGLEGQETAGRASLDRDACAGLQEIAVLQVQAARSIPGRVDASALALPPHPSAEAPGDGLWVASLGEEEDDACHAVEEGIWQEKKRATLELLQQEAQGLALAAAMVAQGALPGPTPPTAFGRPRGLLRATPAWARESPTTSPMENDTASLARTVSEPPPSPSWDSFAQLQITLGQLMEVRVLFLRMDGTGAGRVGLPQLESWLRAHGLADLFTLELLAVLQRLNTAHPAAVDWWAFLGLRLHWDLRLEERNVPLLGWLQFCTQRGSPPVKCGLPGRRLPRPWQRQWPRR